jgi:class 3 adenylate cyclase/tetratricopeptide (TPR) repeat protein
VVCPRCATENKPGRKFCVACAAPLAVACPSCGAAADPGDRFCGECATPLDGSMASSSGPAAALPAIGAQAGWSPSPVAAPASGPAAERRLVSVLFADLVGFTPFAEERDAEDVRETLSRYFDVASEVVARYGGRVEKFIGDAVMALWGAPTAREDDAERAVRAALDLVDAVRVLGPGISARAGVLTGEAAVTLGASNQGLVAGDLVNTASRLQSAAPPGCVLVGEATMRAASAAIDFEAAGDQVLKGKAAPVAAWRALRVAAQRGGQGRSDLPEPPFVGRDDELRMLKDLIATTGRDRRPRLVSITGPGGIGKSRLAWELEKYLDGISEAIWWHRGRSPSYGEGITFWALGEMVRRRCGLVEDADDATTRERVRATVAEFVPGDEDRRWVEPALLTLLGLEPAPSGGRDVLFAAWRIFFERIADRGTVVLLFEDLQWADTGLLDFIDHVLEWARNTPLLVVTLARPELFDRRPGWGSNVRNLAKLDLEPLGDAAMRELLDGFVPGLPAPAVDSILARADGMPLYAVETVRALVADGRLVRDGAVYRPVGELGALAIPETLRSLIASRLDALDPTDRSLIADASVLGQTFSLAGLAALSGLPEAELEPRLRSLVRRQLLDLELDPRSPERGLYAFVQALIREVAYGTLAKRDRRSRHLAAARWYEALGDDELAGALAQHYVAAYEASAEGPEAEAVAVQARLALSAAAERAAALGSNEQAVRYLRSAIALTGEPVARAELLLRAGRAATNATRYADAQQMVREAHDIATASGDAVLAGRAGAALGEAAIDAGEPGHAVVELEAAEAAFPADGPEDVRAEILTHLSRAYMRVNEPRKAIAAADRALELAERLDLTRLVAEALNNKASSMGYVGRDREAQALMAGAVRVARAGGHVAAEIRALTNSGAIAENHRDAVVAFRAASELAHRVGSGSLARWADDMLRWYTYPMGEGWDEAIASARAQLAEDRDRGLSSPFDEARTIAFTTYQLVERGEPADAELARLDELRGQVDDPFVDRCWRSLGGLVAAQRGDYDTAVRLAIEAAAPDEVARTIFASIGARAARWGRDHAGLEAFADVIESDPKGPFAAAHRTGIRAGLLALDGRREDAVAAFRDAVSQLEDLGSRFEAAAMAVDAAVLVGADHPAVREMALALRPVLERCQARPTLERLDAALADAGVAVSAG